MATKRAGRSEKSVSCELRARDGVRLVALTLGMTLYTKTQLTNSANAVLQAQERFLSLCPKETLTFYATESMKRHKPVSRTTFKTLPTWLAKGAPAREYVCLHLKDGEQYQDAPHRKLHVFGLEPKAKVFKLGYANLISLGFPPPMFEGEPEKLRELFVELCTVFPFQSGHCGWVFECSKYEQEISQTHAWGLSMRHRGVDISRVIDDSIAVSQDAVKGVGWLTALDADFVAGLGGMRKIRRSLSGGDVEIIEVPRGLILQAGDAPARGDVNRGDDLPAYKKVFRLLKPLIEIAKTRSPALNLETDYVERTESWFMRLGNV